MKILYHHRIASNDGQYVHIEEMIGAFEEQGHEVIVVSPPGFENDTLGSTTPMVTKLKNSIPRPIYEILEFLYSFIAFRRLSIAIKNNRPDYIYERFSLFLPAGIWAKRRFKLPLFLEVNSPLYEERKRYAGLTLDWLAKWTQRFTWNNADYVLPVTHVLAQRLQTEGVPPDRIVVIPNGVNVSRFSNIPSCTAAKAALGLTGRTVLGFTGFAREWHELDQVVRYLAQCGNPDNHFLLVGDGPAREHIEALAAKFGISDQVTVAGFVSRADIPRYIAAFDVALQPAVTPYASPLKVFEYLAAGTAIVAPDTPNIREILSSGENAILFDPQEKDGFFKAIDCVCSNPDLRQKLAKTAASTIASRRLTWANNARSVTDLFTSLRNVHSETDRHPAATVKTTGPYARQL